MRTTVRIDDELLARVKEFALRHRRSLNSVLEDALRELLDRRERQIEVSQVDLVVFAGDGLRVEVDLADSAAVHELLDEDQADRYRAPVS